jgi:hypothetical protein
VAEGPGSQSGRSVIVSSFPLLEFRARVLELNQALSRMDSNAVSEAMNDLVIIMYHHGLRKGLGLAKEHAAASAPIDWSAADTAVENEVAT